MKKTVSLLLVLCFCFGLAACGKSGSSASPSTATAAPAVKQPTPSPEPTPIDLSPLVKELNNQEVSQSSADDPSVGVFELGAGETTINYKLTMHYFQNVVSYAQAGDAESMSAYNRVLDSLPAVEMSLENALRSVQPKLNIVVYLMADEISDVVVAVIENGEIAYDLVNGIGTAPTGITPILEAGEISPELQEQLDGLKDALTGTNG